MKPEKDIIKRVLAAKGSSIAADDLVRKYLPFIRSECARFIKRIPDEHNDDEFSISMFAFHEAVMAYSESRGAFFPFAALMIKNRLIDFARKESRHLGHLSLDSKRSEEDDRTVADTKELSDDPMGRHSEVSACREELLEFSRVLSDYGLELGDVADNCPRQERTLTSCRIALDYVKSEPHLLEKLERTKKLPLSEIAEGAGLDKKLLERHRRYIVAIMLAYTNGFEMIRGHLGQVGIRRKGD